MVLQKPAGRTGGPRRGEGAGRRPRCGRLPGEVRSCQLGTHVGRQVTDGSRVASALLCSPEEIRITMIPALQMRQLRGREIK